MSNGKKRRARRVKRSGARQGSSDKPVPDDSSVGLGDNQEAQVDASGHQQQSPNNKGQQASNDGNTASATRGCGRRTCQCASLSPSLSEALPNIVEAFFRASFKATYNKACASERKRLLRDARTCLKTSAGMRALLLIGIKGRTPDELVDNFYRDYFGIGELPPMPELETTDSVPELPPMPELETTDSAPGSAREVESSNDHSGRRGENAGKVKTDGGKGKPASPAIATPGSGNSGSEEADKKPTSASDRISAEVNKCFWIVADCFDAMDEGVKRNEPLKVIGKAGTITGRYILLHLASLGGYSGIVAEIIKVHPFLVNSSIDSTLISLYLARKERVGGTKFPVAKVRMKAVPADAVGPVSITVKQLSLVPGGDGNGSAEANPSAGIEVGQAFPGGPLPSRVIPDKGLNQGIQPKTGSQKEK